MLPEHICTSIIRYSHLARTDDEMRDLFISFCRTLSELLDKRQMDMSFFLAWYQHVFANWRGRYVDPSLFIERNQHLYRLRDDHPLVLAYMIRSLRTIGVINASEILRFVIRKNPVMRQRFFRVRGARRVIAMIWSKEKHQNTSGSNVQTKAKCLLSHPQGVIFDSMNKRYIITKNNSSCHVEQIKPNHAWDINCQLANAIL